MGLSVVMPTWNGADLLRESLPLLQRACERAGLPHELVLVDNGSSDDTPAVVAGLTIPTRHVRLPRNEGYAFACNAGIAAARWRRVLLINNDVLVPEGFLDPLLAWELGEVFAVGSAMVAREAAFGPAPAEAPSPREQLGVPTHCCLLDRDTFLELDGFDLLFSPAMWEEMDLGARVWGSGRRVVVDPRSRVFHKTRATVHRVFTYVQMEQLYHRNRLLFLWKNVPAPLLLRHLLLRLPRDCASDVLTRGGPVTSVALLQAVARLRGAAAGRRQSRAAGRRLREVVRRTGEEGDLHAWL